MRGNGQNNQTAIRTGALIRVGDRLRAGRGFSPVIRILPDISGRGVIARLKCGQRRALAFDERVVVRARSLLHPQHF